MDQAELLQKIAVTCEKLAVPYIVVGSMASTVYGEPRMTNDIDVVIDIAMGQIDAFCNEFPSEEFYLSRPAVVSAVQKRFQFNIIHPTSGSKIDCIVAGNDPFAVSELARGRLHQTASGDFVRFASPEDVIIKKLEYFQLGESEKHLRDIAGICRGQGDSLDGDYIRQWAERKGLLTVWEAVLARLASR